MKLRDTIKKVTREHLESDGLLCCQNISGVGAIQNTFPEDYFEHPGVIELPTSDVSNGSISCGFSLVKRTIYIIRFQGFLAYNFVSIVNYAAKSKEMSSVPSPIFVRTIINEGSIGPVASNSHISIFLRYPGLAVFSPITSKEWEFTWDYYMNHDDPVICSEHRATFDINYELEDTLIENNQVVIFAIGYGRINAQKAIKELPFPCSSIKLMQLKPLIYNQNAITALKQAKFGIVVDSDYECCGASTSIAYELMLKSEKPVYALGLEDRTAGFSPLCDNVTPSPERIKEFILNKLNTF